MNITCITQCTCKLSIKSMTGAFLVTVFSQKSASTGVETGIPCWLRYFDADCDSNTSCIDFCFISLCWGSLGVTGTTAGAVDCDTLLAWLVTGEFMLSCMLIHSSDGGRRGVDLLPEYTESTSLLCKNP